MATSSVLQILLFFQSILSTPLNGSLQNFNTWRVLIRNRTLLSDFFGYRLPKNLGPKTTYFRRFAAKWQLWVWLSMAWNLIETVGKCWELQRLPCIVPKFRELWSLMDTYRTIIFTHPLKILHFLHCQWANCNNHDIPHIIKLPTSSAWLWRPSSWPAVWRANIFSFFV